MAKQDDESTPPKVVATINFKGGVGKTTTTWCLGDIIAQRGGRVLMADLDAQMSLTQAVMLNEYRQHNDDRFADWYDKACERRRTIYHALDMYAHPGQLFDFPPGFNMVYSLHSRLHFIPSVQELYWMELEELDRAHVRRFISHLLGRLAASDDLPAYDYILFDCPPSFTWLSYSVLACCDLVLAPALPDFFAARGVGALIEGLKRHLDPAAAPQIAVYGNRVPMWNQTPTKAAAFYLDRVRYACRESPGAKAVKAHFLETYLPQAPAIRDAIALGHIAEPERSTIAQLWDEAAGLLA